MACRTNGIEVLRRPFRITRSMWIVARPTGHRFRLLITPAEMHLFDVTDHRQGCVGGFQSEIVS
jgi:hypothetical protein